MNDVAKDKVLVLGLDGLRHDRIDQVEMPNLRRLIAEGAYGTSLLPYAPPLARTDSGPGWSSIATGVWPGRHGVVDNAFTAPDYAAWPDFLTRAARAGLATYANIAWGDLVVHGTFGPEIGTLISHDGDALGFAEADVLVADHAAEFLATAAVDAAFVQFGGIDEAGHRHGPFSAPYVRQMEIVDTYVGRILFALTRRPAGESWTVVVVPDHGHRDEGNHGEDSPQERGVFVALHGPRVPAGTVLEAPALADVAPTVLNRLGVRHTGLEGRDLLPVRVPG
ncbi:alkaline phosphatase family protein [Actinocorallia longicatena]|uniref:Alkaline phosphatase family protein n=1 Tax=Actinocorallia longicatena TaxID=111803 RepID=A0ABP6QNN5_9ACTN